MLHTELTKQQHIVISNKLIQAAKVLIMNRLAATDFSFGKMEADFGAFSEIIARRLIELRAPGIGQDQITSTRINSIRQATRIDSPETRLQMMSETIAGSFYLQADQLVEAVTQLVLPIFREDPKRLHTIGAPLISRLVEFNLADSAVNQNEARKVAELFFKKCQNYVPEVFSSREFSAYTEAIKETFQSEEAFYQFLNRGVESLYSVTPEIAEQRMEQVAKEFDLTDVEKLSLSRLFYGTKVGIRSQLKNIGRLSASLFSEAVFDY